MSPKQGHLIHLCRFLTEVSQPQGHLDQLFLDELDAAVLGAAFVGGVVGDGDLGALADGAQAAGVDALRDQCGDDCLGALLAEGIVDLVGAGVVAMALDLEVQLGMLSHQLRDAGDFRH